MSRVGWLALALLAYASLAIAGPFGPSVFINAGGGPPARAPFNPPSNNPWGFFAQIGAVYYDQCGLGCAYNATAHPNCAVNGSSLRPDYIDFKNTTDSGQTFRLGCIQPGFYFSWTVNITQTGPFVVNARMSNGDTTAAVWSVSIDGGAPVTLASPVTGSYDTFATQVSAPFNATTGNHTLTLTCTGGSDNGFCGDLNFVQGSNPPAGGIPAPAMSAGFTTLAINSDFTDAAHTNIANWLSCSSGPAWTNPSSPEWFQGWVTVGNGTPCNVSPAPYSVVTDPVYGNQAFKIHWQDSYKASSDIFINQIESINLTNDGGKFFTFFFADVVARASSQTVSANGGGCNSTPGACSVTTDIWSTGVFGQGGTSGGKLGTGVNEYDGIEWYGVANSSMFSHNNDSGSVPSIYNSQGIPPGFSSWDWTQYHRYTWRLTGASNGSGDIQFCAWLEQTPGVSGLVSIGCVGIGATASQRAGNNIGTALILQSGLGFGCVHGECTSPSISYDTYFKSAKVYVCPSWTANQNPVGGAQQCFTSSNNP